MNDHTMKDGQLGPFMGFPITVDPAIKPGTVEIRNGSVTLSAVDFSKLHNSPEPPTSAHICWLCDRACEPHAFYLASDNETAQAICEPCGEENTTDTCGCCGAKGDSVEINELIEVTDDRFPAQTYIAMCSKCEVESDRLSRELDQE